MNLIMLGAPGSGKGTQAKLISQHFGLPRISSGALLREESLLNTPKAKILKSILAAGDLVPFDTVLELVSSKILRSTHGFILDGTPRDLSQAQHLDWFLTRNHISVDKVIFLDLPDDEATSRLLKRATTQGRSDDNQDTIKERLHVYHQETQPLIDYYTTQNKLITIDGRPDIDSIFQDILSRLS